MGAVRNGACWARGSRGPARVTIARAAAAVAVGLGASLAGSAGPAPSATPATPATSTTATTPGASTTPSTSSTPTAPTTTSPSASTPTVPPLSPAATAAGLLDVRSIVPDAVIDLRYATANNFTRVQIYPTGARCLVHEAMRPGLVEAARRLRSAGAVLVFLDCYRPHDAQVRLWEVYPDPAWVARPGSNATSHEAARSVDVTLADAATGRLYDMGTEFDDFTPRATAYATAGLSPTQLAHRTLLREAMAAGGLPIYAGEWWHFDGPESKTPRPHLGVPVA
ncbi:MAG: D-alanyl-D-alanine dipeptidase [Austwickia sp.]|jgi:D-alanyl-D-alanine dipeptidase|nr:MAG: D-alanyl-D-alanine dipeptidase [Austwickia sp.]